jgi:Fic family protein
MVGWQLEVEMAMADREEMPDEEKEATVWSLHVDYEHIHPFIDGNGRSGRLLMINHAILLGIEPWIVEYKDVQNYYNRF